jgi:hypothetical protein
MVDAMPAVAVPASSSSLTPSLLPVLYDEVLRSNQRLTSLNRSLQITADAYADALFLHGLPLPSPPRTPRTRRKTGRPAIDLSSTPPPPPPSPPAPTPPTRTRTMTSSAHDRRRRPPPPLTGEAASKNRHCLPSEGRTSQWPLPGPPPPPRPCGLPPLTSSTTTSTSSHPSYTHTTDNTSVQPFHLHLHLPHLPQPRPPSSISSARRSSSCRRTRPPSTRTSVAFCHRRWWGAGLGT